MSEARELVAISLEDIERMPAALRDKLLGGRLDLTGAQRLVGSADAAVVFRCPVLEAALACDIARSHDRKAGDRPSRVYIHDGRAWRRLSERAILTLLEQGEPRLNPAVFGMPEQAPEGAYLAEPGDD